MMRGTITLALVMMVSSAQAADVPPASLSVSLPLTTLHQTGWLPSETGQPGQPPYFAYLPQVKLYRQGKLVLAGQAYALSKQGQQLIHADVATRISPRVRIRDLGAERALLGIKEDPGGHVLIWAHPDGCSPCESLMANFRRDVLVHFPGNYRLVDVTVN